MRQHHHPDLAALPSAAGYRAFFFFYSFQTKGRTRP